MLETVSKTNGGEQRPIKWYQFKILFEANRHNGISDFRSIRFMRMFMRGWKTVTLRFGRIELVRGEWPLRACLAGLQEEDDPTGTGFALSAVNLEETGASTRAVRDPSASIEIDLNLNQRRLNEQSWRRTCAGWKTAMRERLTTTSTTCGCTNASNVCARQPGRQDEMNRGRNVCPFERRLRPELLRVRDSQADPIDVAALDEYDIWPLENNIDISLDSLRLLSLQKLQNRYVDGEVSTTGVYSVVDAGGKRRLSVKGNPTLSNVVTVMVGIRNPDKDLEQPLWPSDDGQPKCAELWVNELRLSGFNEEGGWAAVAQANATLADLANVSVAANMSVPGWGGLSSGCRVTRSSRMTTASSWASYSLKLGITLPMYVGTATKQYRNSAPCRPMWR